MMSARQVICPDRVVGEYIDYEDLTVNLECVMKKYHEAKVFFKFEGPHPVGFVDVAESDEGPVVRVWDKDCGIEENLRKVRDYRNALCDLGYVARPTAVDIVEVRCR